MVNELENKETSEVKNSEENINELSQDEKIANYVEKHKKFDIRWKNKRKRIIGNLCIALGILVTLGTLGAVGANYLNLSFLGVDVGGTNNNIQYTYDKFADMHIKAEDIYKQKTYQYLVYFYADDCPHCHEIETTVCKYAYDGPVAVYFVEAEHYQHPETILDQNKIVATDEEARSVVGTKSFSDFKFYAFPSMYFFKDESSTTTEDTNNPKTLMGVYIGSEEIPEILEANS